MPENDLSAVVAGLDAIAGSQKKRGKYTDDELVRRTLEHNKHLDFVRRILQPESYPSVTNDPRLQPGDRASHQMSADIVDNGPMAGQWIAYPNIVHDRPTGTLNWFATPQEAMAYALTTGEYIPFPTKESAIQFSSKYKRGSAGMHR